MFARRPTFPLPGVTIAALTWALIATTPAGFAATGDDDLPVLEDPSMERVLPKPGALTPKRLKPVVKKTKTPPPEEEPEEAQLAVSVHGRVTGWADFMLQLAWSRHPGGYLGGSAGVSVEYGPPKSWQVVLEVDWTKVGMPNYNYIEQGSSASSATYAEVDWHLSSVDVSYQGMVRIIDDLYFLYRVGAGLGGLAGSARKAEVVPTCTSDTVSTCPHWRAAANGELESPFPVIPVVHLAVGLSIDVADFLKIRVQGGFRDAFYAGLGVAFNL